MLNRNKSNKPDLEGVVLAMFRLALLGYFVAIVSGVAVVSALIWALIHVFS